MFSYKLLYLASLITYTFGALTFSVLSVSYWKHRKAGGGLAFPSFTLVCAAAFLANLLLQFSVIRPGGPTATEFLMRTLELAAALLPPLLFHVIYSEERGHVSAKQLWQALLVAFYVVSLGSAAARRMEGILAYGPATMLGAAGALGLVLQTFSRRKLDRLERRQRLWSGLLLALMPLCALVNVAEPGDFVSLLPDYLVLAFFCLTLYYKERLVFFDLLVKRGAFFTLALILLTLFFAVGPRLYEDFPDDWSRPWLCALLLLPFWLAGPWIFHRIERAIDRLWLRRRYSPADGERCFIEAIQLAASEGELSVLAAAALGDIFQAPASVRFDSAPSEPGDRSLAVEIVSAGSPSGSAQVGARPNGIPFLSDDRRLLQSLGRTLGVVLENVRFRQQRRRQEEREQQLQWLASRAELKALRAQINPHFLFNALNAIAGLIPEQPELADDTVQQLAEVFRYTLRKSDKEWVRLDEEVEFVTAYLRVEQARFGARLAVEMTVDPAAHGVNLPAMTIQPLVENAIKHGVAAVEGPGRVGLRATLREGLLQIEVWDNGPGFPPGFRLGETDAHGLRNVIERLTGYYGETARLRWENGQAGTRVWLEIPAPAQPGSAEGELYAARPGRG